LFQILQAWGQQQRTKYIFLEHIDPEPLSSTVKSSGLVTSDQLLDAYKTQAHLAKQQHGMFYKKMRVQTWKSTYDVTLSVELFISRHGRPVVENSLCII
jgi:hypothetical protein